LPAAKRETAAAGAPGAEPARFENNARGYDQAGFRFAAAGLPRSLVMSNETRSPSRSVCSPAAWTAEKAQEVRQVEHVGRQRVRRGPALVLRPTLPILDSGGKIRVHHEKDCAAEAGPEHIILILSTRYSGSGK
jgi:hypothetical protein